MASYSATRAALSDSGPTGTTVNSIVTSRSTTVAIAAGVGVGSGDGVAVGTGVGVIVGFSVGARTCSGAVASVGVGFEIVVVGSR